MADGLAWQDDGDEDAGDDDIVPEGVVGADASDEEGAPHDDPECILEGGAPGDGCKSLQENPGDVAEPVADTQDAGFPDEAVASDAPAGCRLSRRNRMTRTIVPVSRFTIVIPSGRPDDHRKPRLSKSNARPGTS